MLSWKKHKLESRLPGEILITSDCKTQNSGLRSKEEKPRDPTNQPSRCNTQEGLLLFAQTGDSDPLGGRAHRTANWASFLYAKKTILSAYYIRVTRWLVTRLQSSLIGTNFAGYMFTKQSYWHKLSGLLFKFKAILLVQTARAFFKLRRPRASQLSRGLFTGCPLIGRLQVTRWGRGIPPFHGNRNPNPGRLPAPHNKTYFSASKTNKKISDTWIIDTGKRETRYQLVKIH